MHGLVSHRQAEHYTMQNLPRTEAGGVKGMSGLPAELSPVPKGK